MARVYPPRLNGSATMQNKAISQLMRDIDRIVLNPSYQRDFVWTKFQSSDLIGTVMHGGIIPPCTLYKFQHGDERPDGMVYECIDGQHRLKTLKHFLSGTWIVQAGKHPFMVTLPYTEENGTETTVFYSRTDNTEEWTTQHPMKNVAYFDEEERDAFRAYILDMKIIDASQSEDQRRELFTSLSRGTPLRGCDVKQNFHNIPLIAEIKHMGWKSVMRDMIRDACHVKAEKFWLHWIIRMFLLSKSPTSEIFALSDSHIGSYMKRDMPTDALQFTTTELEQFKSGMTKFFAFNLKPNGKIIKVSPTRLFVLFVHLLQANEERVQVLESQVSVWTETKDKQRLWTRGHTSDERIAYFDQLNTELTSNL
jgi:hypothetical protein